MADGYRITVRGEMSERFSRGFPGLSRHAGPDRTVLEGGLPAGLRIDDVLAKLDNLGLEVLEVEPLASPPNPSEGGLMSRLASLVTRRPWRVIIIALLFLGVAVVVGAPLTSNLTAGGFEDPDAEFFQARERLEDATGACPGPALIALVEPGTDVRTGEGRAEVERVAATIAEDPDVRRVVTAFDGGGDALISTTARRRTSRPSSRRSATTPSRTPRRGSATSSRTSRACPSAASRSSASRSARSSARISPGPRCSPSRSSSCSRSGSSAASSPRCCRGSWAAS